jgi:hypothetical protein
VRYHASQEELPFDHWQEAEAWDKGASKKGIDLWDQLLRQKVGLENPRFVLLAGSDAHGGFNYSEGWWVDWDGIRADDNCLGKVRTLLYLPERDIHGPRQAPSEAEVVNAIRDGRCIVTDGPTLNFTVAHNGTQVKLGEILTLIGDGAIEVNIQAASTDEFGKVEQVDVIYYFQGMDETPPQPVDYKPGHSHVLEADLPCAPGYIRLAAKTRNGKETYRCFTNPIWIKSASPGKRQLRINYADW